MSIKKILESAILAPSGDNCQPWSLIVKGNQINIINLSERDTSLFNFCQRASLIAHGALIENILIASSASGYNIKLRPFPDNLNPNLIATVELGKSEVRDESLYPYITQRATNRKPYKSIPLTAKQRNTLLNTSLVFANAGVKLVEELDRKAFIAEAIALTDRLVFENPYLHSFLFEHIRWTEEEALKTRDGLYIKTLELSAPQAIGFRLLKNWSILQALNKFGLSKIAAKQAEKLCLSASAIGIIIVDGNTDEDFLTGGRLVQRLWLEATRMGLAFQPMTGLTFLIQRVLAKETKEISTEHIRLIMNAFDSIVSAFNLSKESMVMLFRIGHSSPPAARSLRLSVDQVVKTE